MRFKTLTLILVPFLIACSFLSGLGGALIGQRYLLNNSNIVPAVRQMEIVEEDSKLIDVVENTQDAVVSIIISKDLPVYENYYYSPFGGNFSIPGRRQIGEEEQQVGAGSGFVISPNGMIITNRHVVSDTEAEYTVLMNNGDKVPAKVVDVDSYLDIAVIKVEKKDMKYIKMGDSDKLKVGQRVLAIGNSLGEFSNTVSTGIISGLSRSITAESESGNAETLSNIIQTDASINPGNSGGPLLDINGNAIGVNVAVAQDAENIGFSIPINSVKNIVESVEKYGEIVRPFLGIRYLQNTASLQKSNGLKYDYGVLVVRGRDESELGGFAR